MGTGVQVFVVAEPAAVSPEVGAKARLRRNTAWVLATALLSRAIVIVYSVRHFPSRWFFSRGIEMGLLGQSILEGNGLSSPFGDVTGPTAMIAPGYPMLVAGVFRLFGLFSMASAVALMGLNLGLNVLTAWLLLRLSRRLASEGAAVAVSLLWACSLCTVWMPTIFWETNLSAVLLLGFAAWTLERTESGVWDWCLRGLYVGLAGLVNPALLPSLVVMLGWESRLQPRRRAWMLAAAALGFAVVFSAWPVRNARVFGAFVPTRTTVGFELWMGNRPGATGYLEEALFPMFNRTELNDYKALGEIGYMQHKQDLAEAFVLAHPRATAWLTLVRMGRFWFGLGTRNGSAFFALHAVVTTLLGALGLLCLLRAGGRRHVWVFVVPLCLFPLPYYVTHAEFRYRLVLDPLLCVLAAVGIERVTGRDRAKAAGWLED